MLNTNVFLLPCHEWDYFQSTCSNLNKCIINLHYLWNAYKYYHIVCQEWDYFQTLQVVLTVVVTFFLLLSSSPESPSGPTRRGESPGPPVAMVSGFRSTELSVRGWLSYVRDVCCDSLKMQEFIEMQMLK